jgi:hypothetical protein
LVKEFQPIKCKALVDLEKKPVKKLIEKKKSKKETKK